MVRTLFPARERLLDDGTSNPVGTENEMKTRLSLETIRLLLAATAVLALLCGDASAGSLTYRPLKLFNGWQAYGLGTGEPAAAVDPNGIVHLKGAISQPPGGAGGIAFRLPKKMRPNRDLYLPVGLINGQPGRLTIQPDGRAFVKGVLDQSDATGFTSLEGITFPRD